VAGEIARKRAESVLFAAAILAGLYLTRWHSYLLFHSLIEVFTIVVAFGTFTVAWNARQMLEDHFLLFIGIANLFTAGLDLMHTLSYNGMGVFIGYGPNLPTQLWVAARAVQSGSFLAAPFFLKRKLRAAPVFVIYGALTSLIILSTLVWRNFPDAYLPGIGLTPFKKASELVIILIFALALLFLYERRDRLSPPVWRLISWSILVLILSEVAFTQYLGVYDAINMAGHILRLAAYYLIYRALIATALERPYQLLFFNLKRKEEEIHARVNELQERNEDLDAFAHTVAHDLKNPLAGILLACQAVGDAHMGDEERKELLQEIVATARKMHSLIEALMMLAEVRQSDVPHELLQMDDILSNVRRRLAHEIENTRAEILLPQEWPPAWGYAPWVEEVWVNYLDNAMKYGGHPPRIELGSERLKDGIVRFWVRDYGPGIPPEDQERLFHINTRAGARNRGHGLGLSIVKRVVEKLGGSVGVKSQPGLGSEFYFTLPAKQVYGNSAS